MNCNDREHPSALTATSHVDDAGGVPCRKWFVAVVNRNTEKATRKRLAELGYEAYVPTQEETHVWRNGQRKQIEHVLIPALIFIKVTEKERRQLLTLPNICHFMTDKAREADAWGRHPLAVVPDAQMQQLKFMLFNADRPVQFTPLTVRLGDRIRVIRGKLRGLEGNVVRMGGTTSVAVAVDCLGCAMMTIDSADIEKV